MDHKLESGPLKVFISQRGAEITSVKNREGIEYLWQAGAAWRRHAPVLFPIVGRLKEDTYYVNSIPYKLPQHGFARDKDFRLVEKSPGHCAYELQPDAESRQAYPFEFVFRITYRLEENKLSCVYSVTNNGNDRMHFSVGAHPGFRCPLEQGESFTDYYLEFEQRVFLQTTLSGGLRTNETKVLPLEGKKLALTKTLFDQDALVFENHQVNTLALVSARSGRRVTINCGGWPYFGVWSKKGNGEFVCLEPWHGVTDHVESSQQLTEKQGIIGLEPGSHFTAEFEMVFA